MILLAGSLLKVLQQFNGLGLLTSRQIASHRFSSLERKKPSIGVLTLYTIFHGKSIANRKQFPHLYGHFYSNSSLNSIYSAPFSALFGA
jgi:hypothetical protein